MTPPCPSRIARPGRPPEARFNAIAFGLVVVLATAGTANHAMFCDEMQAWLITRDSATPWTIFQNLRYEGHPILWYLMIWPAAQLTWAPDAMKPVSLAAIFGAIAIFLWRGPWTRAERLLWPLGYYVLFEYGIKSRNYGIGILLLFLFCALWRQRTQRIVTIGLVLGLMANTHVYFAVVAAAGAIALLVDRLAMRGWPGLIENLRRDAVAGVIMVGAAAFALLTAAPPATGDYSQPRPADAMPVVLALGDVFWPMMRGYLEGEPSPFALAAEVGGIAIVAFTLIVTCVRARTCAAALAFLVTSLGGILGFFYFGLPARTQHSGMIVVVLTAGIWLRRATTGDRGGGDALWRFLLVCQALAGVLTVLAHFHMPYSNGRRVADFIRDQGWATQSLAGVGPWFSTVCGYLERPACYYVDRRRMNSYFVQDGPPQSVNDTSPPDVTDLAMAMAMLPRPVTFVATAGFDNPDAIAILARHGFRRIGSFTGATIENFTIFRGE